MHFEHKDISSYAAVASERRPTRETIRQLVADILAAQGQTAPFGDDETLAEIGVGSVDMVALLLALESTFDLEVPQHEINIDVFRSVGTLDAMVCRLRPAAPPSGETFMIPSQAGMSQAAMIRALCNNDAG